MFPTDFPTNASEAGLSSLTALDWINAGTGLLTVVAAFAGFTVGSLINHWFSRRLEAYKQAQKAKEVARALAAELVATKIELDSRIVLLNKYKEHGLENYGIADLKSVILSVGKVDLHVYRENIANLGLLPPKISANLIKVSIALAGYDRMALSYVSDVFDAGMEAVRATYDSRAAWTDAQTADKGVKDAYALIEQQFDRLLKIFADVSEGLAELAGELGSFASD